MRFTLKRLFSIILSAVAVLNLTAVCAVAAIDTGGSFLHYKTGVETEYLALSDGTAALGNGTDPAIPADTESIIIPADVTYFEKWETVHPCAVSKISTNAFYGCDSLSEIYIEGAVSLDGGALDGLADGVTFKTGSLATKKALTDYGIPAELITYEPIVTKYVAFGDSIAAGYALPEYNEYDNATELAYDGDRFPTPPDAFVNLTGTTLGNQGAVVIDNQAVSGWTSQQLLTMLESGAYDAALKNADVVTVTIGSNDLLGPFLKIVAAAIAAEFGESEDAGVQAEVSVSRSGTVSLRLPVRIKSKMEDFVSSIGNVTASLNETLADNKVLNAVCVEFCEVTQPAILAQLSEKAPDAAIYWTTLYNPFYGARLDPRELFPGIESIGLSADVLDTLQPIELSDLGAQYIEKMNQAFEINTEGYTVVPLYDSFNVTGLTNVNISRDAGENPDSLLDDSLSFGFDPHPNTIGHRLIYDIIMPYIDSTYTPDDNMSFTDITKSDWFYSAVEYVRNAGLIYGNADGSFEPYKKASRAVIVAALWRAAGSPAPLGNISFKDVLPGEWYEKAVAWAAENGITEGYDNGLFGIEDSVTREQLAVFFSRLAEAKGYDISGVASLSAFSDSEKVSEYAKTALEWAVSKGIIKGRGDGSFDPQGTATQAELAAMLQRFVQSADAE